jgi:hypothetical protein
MTSGRAAKTSVAQGTKTDFKVRSTGTIALCSSALEQHCIVQILQTLSKARFRCFTSPKVLNLRGGVLDLCANP